MPRKATGSVIPPREGRGWAIRFVAYGKRRYVTLGTTEEGWSRERAEAELRHTLADVERGIWKPNEPVAVEPPPETPTFHEFASEWLANVSTGLRPKTQTDYRWRLVDHLLPYFAEFPLNKIAVEDVDRYRAFKERERDQLAKARVEQTRLQASQRKRLPRPMSNGSINKTIRLLAVILDQAVEYDYIARNPAKGRKRLLRESRPDRSYLQPDQVSALLSAAAELDEQADDERRRRPLLATLALAGLRIGEALGLHWRDVNLAARTLRVTGSKTDAGIRTVNLTPTLQEILTEYRAQTSYPDAKDLVFPSGTGARESDSNVRSRDLAKSAERANEKLIEAGGESIEHVTPHSLRRTFISLLLATGADVPYVMAQAGHSDPKMTLGIYGQVIASQTDHGAALDGLIGAADWAATGSGGTSGVDLGLSATEPDQKKTRSPSGFSERAADGIRTHDLLHGKQGEGEDENPDKPHEQA